MFDFFRRWFSGASQSSAGQKAPETQIEKADLSTPDTPDVPARPRRLRQRAPKAWMLAPLPPNVPPMDDATRARVEAIGKMTEARVLLGRELSQYGLYRSAMGEHIARAALMRLWELREDALRIRRYGMALLPYHVDRFPGQMRGWFLRRLAWTLNGRAARFGQKRIANGELFDVALPTRHGGPWDASGYRNTKRTVDPGRAERLGLPRLETLAEMRELLGIPSERHLSFLLIASERTRAQLWNPKVSQGRPGPYVTFTIPKRGGGVRMIAAPGRSLKRVQRLILKNILAKIPVHDAAHGFVPGRSTATNAAMHAGAALVIKFDLRDFFPTLAIGRLTGLFASLGYAAQAGELWVGQREREVAACLARLCSFMHAGENTRVGGYNRVAPQGAPTSPAISNLICRVLDARLSGLARKFGGVYTRYADDLTFSFPTEQVDIGRFRWWVDAICFREGFLVNQEKFRVLRPSQRMSVTGVVVNQTLNAPRELRRKLRAILHNCRKHGLASQAKGRPGFVSWLRGMASYVNMIRPDEGGRLLTEIDELVRREPQR